MGIFTKGDIVLFPFPYTDLSQRKLRPCLVLSDEMREDIILCQITSQQIQKDQYSIELRQNQIQEGNLMINSYIRANMIFTSHKSQILKKIGKVSDEVYRKVTSTILEIVKNPQSKTDGMTRKCPS